MGNTSPEFDVPTLKSISDRLETGEKQEWDPVEYSLGMLNNLVKRGLQPLRPSLERIATACVAFQKKDKAYEIVRALIEAEKKVHTHQQDIKTMENEVDKLAAICLFGSTRPSSLSMQLSFYSEIMDLFADNDMVKLTPLCNILPFLLKLTIGGRGAIMLGILTNERIHVFCRYWENRQAMFDGSTSWSGGLIG
jgi:hypothetical protein